MLLEMQEGIIYGPVNSRRLGKSLGINLMPSDIKACSFNCIYCQYGWTQNHYSDLTEVKCSIPDSDQVVSEVEKALRSTIQFEYLTFSGNGESTIHPNFPEIVTAVVRLRDSIRPGVKIALLSNSSGLRDNDVFDAISMIDFPIFKLDAGDEKLFRKINLPAKNITFSDILTKLVQLPRLLIQTALFDGKPSNVTDDALQSYFEKVQKINPQEVHIYSIERPSPDVKIFPIPGRRLEEIAKKGFENTGIQFKAFYREY